MWMQRVNKRFDRDHPDFCCHSFSNKAHAGSQYVDPSSSNTNPGSASTYLLNWGRYPRKMMLLASLKWYSHLGQHGVADIVSFLQNIMQCTTRWWFQISKKIGSPLLTWVDDPN